MAVPKRKTTPSKRGMRRAHSALNQINLAEDSVSGELKRTHHISKDGYYNGKKVMVTRAEKRAAKAEAAAQEEQNQEASAAEAK